MKLKPLADRVIIAPTAAEEVTASGIIIPDSAKEKPLRGTVIAVGNGTKDEEMVLKEGDKVLYGKYAHHAPGRGSRCGGISFSFHRIYNHPQSWLKK